jgi:lipopolysaccharide export LptBFGC system permease protein LptF
MADNFNHNFIPIKVGLILYTAFCFIEKKLPGKNIIMLLCCLVGYFFVYIMTPLGLEWHLATSIDRVLMQLMPSFIYVLAFRLSSIDFSLADKQLQ